MVHHSPLQQDELELSPHAVKLQDPLTSLALAASSSRSNVSHEQVPLQKCIRFFQQAVPDYLRSATFASNVADVASSLKFAELPPDELACRSLPVFQGKIPDCDSGRGDLSQTVAGHVEPPTHGTTSFNIAELSL